MGLFRDKLTFKCSNILLNTGIFGQHNRFTCKTYLVHGKLKMAYLLEQALVLHSVVSFEGPEHEEPPYCGTGFVHVLSRSDVPPPQETVHSDHKLQSLYPPSIGQFSVLQLSLFSESPEHSCPPNWGGGFVHVRLRERVPPPQVTEQEDHPPHSEYFP